MDGRIVRPGTKIIFAGMRAPPPKAPPVPGSASHKALEALQRIVEARKAGRPWDATEFRRELVKLQGG